jgi:hypothetical protein
MYAACRRRIECAVALTFFRTFSSRVSFGRSVIRSILWRGACTNEGYDARGTDEASGTLYADAGAPRWCACHAAGDAYL